MKSLCEGDGVEIAALLVGRRIVGAEQGEFPVSDGHYWDTPTGKLTLDDGTVILVKPNQGGCACSAGDYYLTSLATVNNVITDVRVVCESDSSPDSWYAGSQSYRIYVVADAVEINAVQIDGDDGNGYYGTGYELIVIIPGEDN
jgi:hypothetical protein